MGQLSFDDIRKLVADAIRAEVSGTEMMGMGPYIEDMYPDKVIYEMGDQTYSRSYSVTDGVVTLGDPVEVEEVWIAKQAAVYQKQFSTEERKKLASEGKAKPDGSYPIVTTQDLKNAIRAWGRGGATVSDKEWIIKRAKALGATNLLPKSWTMKQSITVASLEGVKQVEIKVLDEAKGVSIVCAGEKVIQYQFDMLSESGWTPETMAAFIKARSNKGAERVVAVLRAEISEPVGQSYLAPETLAKLKAVDADPMVVPLRVKYGVGSNKQSFNREFFDRAGAKFEGTPFLFNHSDLAEFGKANPVGSIVKFVGTDNEAATFAAYVSASEGTLRQKIKESQALGDKGFVRKISIEGIPSRSDFTLDQATGIKHFHDLSMPTGIAIVNVEGMKGSQIVA